jgi:hypothetical protein
VKLGRLFVLWTAAASAGALLAPGCIARGDDPLVKQTDDDGGSPGPISALAGDASSGCRHHAARGASRRPPHGPWNGGQRR